MIKFLFSRKTPFNRFDIWSSLIVAYCYGASVVTIWQALLIIGAVFIVSVMGEMILGERS